MATLKATLNITSNTLFPIPVNFTETVNETVNGSHSSFSTNVIAPNATETLFQSASGSGTSGILYFYFKAAATNADVVIVKITRNDTPAFVSVPIFRIAAGDIAILPIDANDTSGIVITATNNSGSSSVTLQYFYGEKG
jgi:hypothetical protein